MARCRSRRWLTHPKHKLLVSAALSIPGVDAAVALAAEGCRQSTAIGCPLTSHEYTTGVQPGDAIVSLDDTVFGPTTPVRRVAEALRTARRPVTLHLERLRTSESDSWLGGPLAETTMQPFAALASASSASAAAAAAAVPPPSPPSAGPEDPQVLELGQFLASQSLGRFAPALLRAGVRSLEDLAQASDECLIDTAGLSEEQLSQLRGHPALRKAVVSVQLRVASTGRIPKVPSGEHET